MSTARRGTYSIVARDPAGGELGAAVQSHWFSVGSVVTWARPGVGAAVTQSVAEVAHGPAMLERMQDGLAAKDAVPEVLVEDELAAYRQLGAVDAAGGVAAHTGEGCIEFAADVQGLQFSCQANMMASPGVPEAMAHAFAQAGGDLAARMLAALLAGEDAGGDVRGRQSAALLVAPAQGEPWRRRFDVRVEDHQDPLSELARLLELARAYELAAEADELLAAGAGERALALYREAAGLAPQSAELAFWAGVGVASVDFDAGLALVRGALELGPGFADLLARLPAELAPTAAALAAALSPP